jgi:hypothetical protein
MPFMMRRDIADDGAFIEQVSHEDLELNSGERLPDSFSGPVAFALDMEIEGGGTMPTLFDIPTFVAKNAFVELLRANGVDNIEVIPAEIANPETGQILTGYSYINVVGLIDALDLDRSDSQELGEDVRLIDRPVLRPGRGGQLPRLFRLAEDTLRLIVDDDVAEAIRVASFDDVYLEELEVS